MALLNARWRFGVPALAPALLNVGMIVFGLALIPCAGASGFRPSSRWRSASCSAPRCNWASSCRRSSAGASSSASSGRRAPGVRRVALLAIPATIGLAATNVNIFVSNNLASRMEQGAVTWLYCAFRLMQAADRRVRHRARDGRDAPALSRAAVNQTCPSSSLTLSAAVRLVLLLTIPAAVYLAVMARLVIALLFQHGRFTAAATDQTAAALVMYCVGLPCFAAVGIFTRTFYALGDTKTPMRSGVGRGSTSRSTSRSSDRSAKLRAQPPQARARGVVLGALANVSQLTFLLRGPHRRLRGSAHRRDA